MTSTGYRSDYQPLKSTSHVALENKRILRIYEQNDGVIQRFDCIVISQFPLLPIR